MLRAVRNKAAGACQRVSVKSKKAIARTSSLQVFKFIKKFNTATNTDAAAQVEAEVEDEVNIIDTTVAFDIDGFFQHVGFHYHSDTEDYEVGAEAAEAQVDRDTSTDLDVVAPGQVTPEQSLFMTDLPRDVIFLFFDELVKNCTGKPTSAVSFGLAHPKFYPILKHFLKDPIEINEHIELVPGNKDWYLRTAITDFMGHEYRFGKYSQKFLSREVYGDYFSDMERALNSRYLVWNNCVRIMNVTRNTETGHRKYFLRKNITPKPHNVGDMWYYKFLDFRWKVYSEKQDITLLAEHIKSERGATWEFVDEGWKRE